jgi:diguanylate cyclase (GGDEF)-like protein/PAS domain S-box-containing protein
MSSTVTPPPAPMARTRWWQRLHAALMPDYNRRATTYWWLVVALGALVIAHAVAGVAQLPEGRWLQVLVGVTVAMLAGMFPVRVPRSKNSFAAGEIFIFSLLLLYGPAAATLASAGEALVGSWRTSKRWSSRIASPAMAAVAMACAGTLLDAALSLLQRHGWSNAPVLLTATILFAFGYFVINTLLVTLVPKLKRNERLTPSELFGNFGWIGIAYAGSASVATLLFLTYEQSGIGVLIAGVPIIGLLMATMHMYLRQQEADEAMRKGRLEAVEREQEQAQRHVAELRRSEQRFHSAFTHAFIGMTLLRPDGRILQANRAFRSLLGLGDQELSAASFSDFVCAEDVGGLAEQLARVSTGQCSSFSTQLRCRHRDGTDVWVAVSCSVFSERDDTSPCLILQAHDISARRHAEARLQHIAFHDSLTGLPNRHRFHELLGRALERVSADGARQFGVLFLDFDRFKLINDSLGHSAGDEFLVQIARRLQGNVRPGDIVARLGGDEFAILVEGTSCVDYAIALAERLLVSLRQPLRIAGTEINTSASIGITSSEFGYADPGEVLRDADIAMYRAKAAGKARYAMFDLGLRTAVSQRLTVEGELRAALLAQQLSIEYQPLFSLSTGALTGFEALARWNHPRLGRITPAEFIPVAEESGLIIALTDFVLQRACHQLRHWQDLGPQFADLAMHINISGNDLGHQGLVGRVTHALLSARLKPQDLTLELTENILMARLENALPMLDELRRLGVQLSVDDFGTGSSSLSHLSSLPFDSLKIDKSFVHGLSRGSNAAIVNAIVYLAHALGKTVIAEGIETPSQFNMLCKAGCESGQGYHMAGSLTPQRVDTLLGDMLDEEWALDGGAATRAGQLCH